MKTVFITAALLLASSAQATSIFKDNDDAIAYRQAAFTTIRYNMGALGDMAKGKTPFDAAQFQQRANNLALLTTLPWEAFIAGSDKGKTDAKAEVWQDRATFDGKAKKFMEYAQALATAAQSGDEQASKAAFMTFAKACKDCHNSFKK